MNLAEPVTSLKGIGPKKAAALDKLGIKKIEDLLFFFPRDYQDRRNICTISQLQEGVPAFVRGRIQGVTKDVFRRGKKQNLRIQVSDGTGQMEIVFFNGAYLAEQFKRGKNFEFFGNPVLNYGKIQMLHPDYAAEEKGLMKGILPVYPLASGVTQKEMRSWQKQVLSQVENLEEYLPEDILQRNRLCSLEYAITNIHFPQERQPLMAGKYRLIFDELLALQTGLLAAKQKTVFSKKGPVFCEGNPEEYIKGLSYNLTHAQKRVVGEILADMESGKLMNRLVQGDVGSGKTVVAEIALYKAVKNGFQGVLMAPTEILAKQHFFGLQKSFERHGIKVGLLTGSMKAAEKRQVLEELSQKKVQILVGTHAVIQPNVVFAKLGLVITDEQHRFGVKQRTVLSEKGENPHVLVMTATPIPRTLAVILYGDLDVSVIDELPPGRQKIITKSADESCRDVCYAFAQQEMEKGRQVYVVAPLIEESEVLDVLSVQELYEELCGRFPQYSVELLHGAMKQNEKDEIMNRFYENEIQVLVSTVVIEVGINVPNATVMIIENAERFGLAQLHQLRGRVGRGKHQSYCMLISKNSSDIAGKRAEIMVQSQDGFYIAEQDLELRGPGEIFGTRQHGVPDLVIADLAKHTKILKDVKKEADAIMEKDPQLSSAEFGGLRQRITKLFGEEFSLKL